MSEKMIETIRVFAGNSLHAPFDELVPLFERESGHKVSALYETAKGMLELLKKGEIPDVLIVSAPNMESLLAEKQIVAGTSVGLIRNCVGVAVRGGAPKPDISTPQAFKEAVLAAKTVAYASSGTSGIYFADLIKRMGIESQVLAKARTRPGGLIGKLVASGEAELAIQQIPELRAVPGIDLVGPLPREIQLDNVMYGGVYARSPRPEAAHALVRYLATPASMRIFLSKGFLPI